MPEGIYVLHSRCHYIPPIHWIASDNTCSPKHVHWKCIQSWLGLCQNNCASDWLFAAAKMFAGYNFFFCLQLQLHCFFLYLSLFGWYYCNLVLVKLFACCNQDFFLVKWRRFLNFFSPLWGNFLSFDSFYRSSPWVFQTFSMLPEMWTEGWISCSSICFMAETETKLCLYACTNLLPNRIIE